MTMKKAARSVHRGIFEHRKRTSLAYEQLAHAPGEVAEHFLDGIRNPLIRRYAASRIEEARTDVMLKRVVSEELDPFPYIHEHDGCIVNGQRTNVQDDHDVFSPRVEMGFVADESAYQEQ